MKLKFFGITSVILLMVLLASCSNGRVAPSPQPAPPVVPNRDNSQAAELAKPDDSSVDKPIVSAPIARRIVLQKAELSLVVVNAIETATLVTSLADELGGWIVTSNTFQATDNAGKPITRGAITIRIPADKFVVAMQRIKSASVSVSSEVITGEDVTQQYTDLSSQLVNLQATEVNLRKIMDAATRTEDVLSVYRQLNEIRSQIEVAKGRLKYYDEASAYSSIAMTLSPESTPSVVQVAGWEPEKTFRMAVSALFSVVQAVVDVMILVGVLVLPFAIPFGIVVWVIQRRSRGTVRPTRVKP